MLTARKVGVLSLYFFALDIWPYEGSIKESRIHRSFVTLLVWIGLTLSVVLAGGHVVSLSRRDLGSTAADLNVILNSFRHLAVKVCAAVILLVFYSDRLKMKQLVVTLSEIVTFRKEDFFVRHNLSRDFLIRLVPVYGIVIFHTVGSLFIWYGYLQVDGKEFSGTDTFISRATIRSWPKWAKIVQFSLDSYTYTVYVYGSRLMMASIISCVCRILSIMTRRINEDIRGTITKMGIQFDPSTAQQVQNLQIGGDKNEIRSILLQLYKLRSTHEQVTQCFGTLLFISIATDFTVGVIDIAQMATHASDKVRFLEFNYMNFALSWIPIIIIYLSGASVARDTEETHSLLKQRMLFLHIYQASLWMSSCMKNNLNKPQLAAMSMPTMKGYYSSAQLQAHQDLMTDSREMTGKDPLPLNIFTPVYLSMGGLINIDRLFILNFIAALSSFTVMLIQLLPTLA